MRREGKEGGMQKQGRRLRSSLQLKREVREGSFLLARPAAMQNRAMLFYGVCSVCGSFK